MGGHTLASCLLDASFAHMIGSRVPSIAAQAQRVTTPPHVWKIWGGLWCLAPCVPAAPRGKAEDTEHPVARAGNICARLYEGQ